MSAGWDRQLAPEAFHGLAGEIVEAVMPTTEADAAGVLVSLLVTVGSMAGRDAYWEVSGTAHPAALFAVLVGRTGEGRKGTANSAAQLVPRLADPGWAQRCVANGLTTGEGLIHHVRDASYSQQPVREDGGRKGPIVGYEAVLDDPGVEDKRLLAIESEFAGVLKVADRPSNILTIVVRQAWDGSPLRVMAAKKNGERGAPA